MLIRIRQIEITGELTKWISDPAWTRRTNLLPSDVLNDHMNELLSACDDCSATPEQGGRWFRFLRNTSRRTS